MMEIIRTGTVATNTVKRKKMISLNQNVEMEYYPAQNNVNRILTAKATKNAGVVNACRRSQ